VVAAQRLDELGDRALDRVARVGLGSARSRRALDERGELGRGISHERGVLPYAASCHASVGAAARPGYEIGAAAPALQRDV
jgi:hypothetical protein